MLEYKYDVQLLIEGNDLDEEKKLYNAMMYTHWSGCL